MTNNIRKRRLSNMVEIIKGYSVNSDSIKDTHATDVFPEICWVSVPADCADNLDKELRKTKYKRELYLKSNYKNEKELVLILINELIQFSQFNKNIVNKSVFTFYKNKFGNKKHLKAFKNELNPLLAFHLQHVSLKSNIYIPDIKLIRDNIK